MTDNPALATGFHLGHYEIRRALGTNGVVLTYRARDLRTLEKLWLEELLPVDLARRSADGVGVEAEAKNAAAFEALREAFLRQGEQRIGLASPALARVRECFAAHGTAYLVLDAAEGTPLEDRLGESDRPWTWGETSALGLPLVEAIAELHARGLVHLDIHPGNILLRAAAPPVLLGTAGLAELRGQEPALGYGAVETFARKSVPGPAADLYALGAVLYRCLSGTMPPDARARLSALSRGEADPLAAPVSYGEGRPGPYVVDTLMAMLRALPHERLSSAAMARERLKSRRLLVGPASGTASEAGVRPEKSRGGAVAPRRSASAGSYLRWLWAPALVIGGVYAYQSWQIGQRDEKTPVLEARKPDTSSPTMDAGKKQPPTDDSRDGRGRVAPGAAAEAEAFARSADEERIRRYREQQQFEKAAAERNAAGRRLLADGRLTEPDNPSAASEFRAALALDAGNTDARRGLNDVALRLLRQAEEELGAGRLDDAQRLLDRAAGVQPEHKRLGELRGALTAERTRQAEAARLAEQQQMLERERARQIEEWLTRAEAALRQDQLSTPVGTSALDYFRQVLSLAPENEAAREGMRRIAARYLDLAREVLARDRLDDAEQLLNSAAAVRPDDPTLVMVRAQIQTRRQTLALAAERDKAKREQDQARQERDKRTGEDQEKRRQETDLKAGLDAYYTASYGEAHTLLRPLADQGVARAQFRLAVMYQRGRGVETNAALAQEWARRALPNLRRAAEAGEAWAQSDLGTLYEQGFVLDKDEAEAVRWYRRAATQGYAGAQTNLGVMYAQGRGVEQNREQAIEWLKRGAAQGDRLARENLRALGAE